MRHCHFSNCLHVIDIFPTIFTIIIMKSDFIPTITKSIETHLKANYFSAPLSGNYLPPSTSYGTPNLGGGGGSFGGGGSYFSNGGSSSSGGPSSSYGAPSTSGFSGI